MLLGLRGVGKTVLLNKIEEMAEAAGHVSPCTKRLDDGFFKVRFDRLTPKER
jgi:hypothetical protein